MQEDILKRLTTSVTSLERSVNSITALAQSARILSGQVASLANQLDATKIPLADGIVNLREAITAASAPSEPAPTQPVPTTTIPSPEGTARLFKLDLTKPTVREALGDFRLVLINNEAYLSKVDGGLLYSQPGGGGTKQQTELYLSRLLTDMWMHWRFKYSPNWTTKGILANTANAYKLAGYGWNTADARGTLELTNTTQYTHNVSVTPKAGQTQPRMWVVEQNGPNISTEWEGTQAFDYFLHVSTVGSTITQTWWHGPASGPIVKRSTISGSMSVGLTPLIERVMIGMNFNQCRETNQSQSILLQEASVYDGTLISNPYRLPL